MVKILSIFLATLAAISPVAQAGNCRPGLRYCGSTLQRYDFPGAGNLLPAGLYRCTSPKEVEWVLRCPIGCQDQGAGQSDRCF
ncbi:hypothetical protein E4U31_004375 [Claviceps sp. LM219 group G6]|nr:hypothetical protein E4U31_004375 [Claviceps sp. LM219 group G6]